ncbi:hypothetical protein FF38_00600 [Lucilia cuprina]|uniref:Uncharacterized protein n=1 Tax=Lucilia cuprina TaxID=7375 RepID=A0A0L0BZ57_LUCCU|nr:hypothetical protein FF38_00600 [Lucilia cuprina]
MSGILVDDMKKISSVLKNKHHNFKINAEMLERSEERGGRDILKSKNGDTAEIYDQVLT